jgi:hypothetical protein
MPTLTVYVAVPGVDNAGSSISGHTWYSINDGSGEQQFGFGPVTALTPMGPGQEDTGNDISIYQSTTVYSEPVQISQEQYDSLLSFGNNPQAYGFNSTYYNAFTNNCIDFVWAALNSIGIQYPVVTDFTGGDPAVVAMDALPLGNILAFSTALSNFEQNGPQQPQSFNQNTYDSDGDLIETQTTNSAGTVIATTTYVNDPSTGSVTATTADGSGNVVQTLAGSIDDLSSTVNLSFAWPNAPGASVQLTNSADVTPSGPAQLIVGGAGASITARKSRAVPPSPCNRCKVHLRRDYKT